MANPYIPTISELENALYHLNLAADALFEVEQEDKGAASLAVWEGLLPRAIAFTEQAIARLEGEQVASQELNRQSQAVFGSTWRETAE